MERWAANTLRTLGIILTAGFVLVTSLILLLLSMCAAQGDFGGNKHPDQVVPYLIAAGLVVILGVLVIVRLARGIYRSPAIAGPTPASIPAGALPPSAPAPTRSDIPLHLSPLSRQSITQLVLALAAQIVVSSAAWFFGQLHFWSAPRAFAPHNWTLFLLAPFVLSHIPYAILIYVLLKRPDRRAFTYAIAVPAVLILESLLSVSLIGRYYVHQPMGLVLLLVPWLIHIVIIALAYKAIQQTGLHPEPASLLVAALVAFAFFSLIHVVTPFLYRFIPYRFIPR
jgi:hypothetical protein